MRSLREPALVIVAACGSAAHPPPGPELGPVLGTTHACQTRAIEPTAAPAPVPPPPSAQRLLASTNELIVAGDVTRGEPGHGHVAHALHALADALEVVAPTRASEILRVRHAGDELGRSSGRATTHADLVRIGLDAAASALATVTPRSGADAERFRDALAAMADATAAVDPDRELLPQVPQVREAFRAAVQAVFAAVGAPVPEIVSPVALR